jgi:hypothetical protein
LPLIARREDRLAVFDRIDVNSARAAAGAAVAIIDDVRMTTTDPVDTGSTHPRFARGRFALREYVTGFDDCWSTTVLPDAPVAVLAAADRLAAVDLDTGAVDVYPIGGDLSVRAMVGLTGRRILAVRFDRIEMFHLDGSARRVRPIRRWTIRSESSVLDVSATATGSRFVVAAGDRFYLGDVESRRRLVCVESPDETFYGSAGCLAAYVSPDGGTLAVGRVGSIDVHTGGPGGAGGEPLRRIHDLSLNTKGYAVLSIGMSPDGRRLVAGDDYATSALFDLHAGTRAGLSEGGKVVAVKWTPDGGTCALVMLTRTVGLLDPSGRLQAELSPDEAGTYYFLGGGWAGDDRFVVGTEHGKVLAWSHEAEDQRQDPVASAG